ncbi:MAG: tripartite tricarboxylate transporter substrate binding protein [Burkholderiales bacterium]|nr:tripartite tricarboxylate transporter substrate binding protein [Burkholderiales bacterium]
MHAASVFLTYLLPASNYLFTREKTVIKPDFARLLLVGISFVVCTSAAAQTADAYPSRPIRVIVTYPPGGGVDLAARTIGQKLTDAFGQQVIIDNRGGGGGNIAMDMGARAQPDGYTLVMSAAGPTAINVSLYSKIPFDPVRDFAPVARVASTIYALVVHPSVEARSVKDLIALAKASPGKLTFASAGIGAPPHLAGELLKSMAGIDIIHVPYKGTGPAIADLMGGQVTMMFSDALAAAPQIRAGKLRGLAVSSPKRFPLVPDLPTVSESGVPGFSAVGWTGLLAPAGTPRPIVQKLNTAIVRVLPLPDVREKLAGDGSEFGKNTPEEFSAFIREEITKWGKVIKASGARAD